MPGHIQRTDEVPLSKVQNPPNAQKGPCNALATLWVLPYVTTAFNIVESKKFSLGTADSIHNPESWPLGWL